MTTTKIRQSETGSWYADDALGVAIRLVNADDTTANEAIEYDRHCGLCWLGGAHSGDFHRREVRERQFPLGVA